MKVYVESKEQIIEKRADNRGRVTLGGKYANKEVQLAVLCTPTATTRIVQWSC